MYKYDDFLWLTKKKNKLYRLKRKKSIINITIFSKLCSKKLKLKVSLT